MPRRPVTRVRVAEQASPAFLTGLALLSLLIVILLIVPR
jgi:hypothetical protein